jgi:hypothetical protein
MRSGSPARVEAMHREWGKGRPGQPTDHYISSNAQALYAPTDTASARLRVPAGRCWGWG